MTPAEQLVMGITSPILDGFDADYRLYVARSQNADNRYNMLSAGERAVMRMAAAIDAVGTDILEVDDLWRERIGDALVRTAGEAYNGVAS
jgi:hypothetical protein